LRKKRNLPQNLGLYAKVGTTAPMEYPMNDVFKVTEKPGMEPFQERRNSKREECSIKANYMVKARWHQGLIQNISDSGAYITPIKGKQFSPGEKIFLVARIRVLRDQVRGKIAWLGHHGMGIEFTTTKLISFNGGL